MLRYSSLRQHSSKGSQQTILCKSAVRVGNPNFVGLVVWKEQDGEAPGYQTNRGTDAGEHPGINRALFLPFKPKKSEYSQSVKSSKTSSCDNNLTITHFLHGCWIF